MQEAFKGWAYVTVDIPVGAAYSNSTVQVQLMYVQLSQYEKNPFRLKFNHIKDKNTDADCIRLDNLEGEDFNNMAQLLSIASKYFERGKSSILAEMQK
jgi:hypothetical protein